MIRVAMVTDHAASGSKVDGGVQAVTKYLVDAFVRRDELDLHVIGFNYEIGSARVTKCEGYTLHTLPGASGGALTGYRKDQRTLNRALEGIQPDIVHGQGAGQNGIVASRSRFPSVITIHGIMAEEAKFYTGLAKRVRHQLLSKWSDRYCIRNGRHTILISPYVAQYFQERLAGQQYLIANPIADEFFDIVRCETGNRVLFAGRLYALKGVIDLVRATAKVARTQDIKLALAGSLHDREYVRQLQQEAAQLNLNDRVEFCGLLDEDELRKELARSSVLVLPSYQETAPLVIAEAMAAGLPVIASDVGGIRYQVRDGETGFLIKPGDVTTLAARLEELLAAPDQRKSFGETARRLAIDEYSANRVAARTLDVYRAVLYHHSAVN
jgi:glycosyltransferase involved in cell wall biosynthesis